MLANQFGSEPEGLGQVTADFGHLSDQALKVGQQLDETGDRLKARLAELANLAQMGTDATDILMGSVAESATLAELEHILEPSAVTSAVTSAGLAPAQDASVVEGRSLKNQVCHNEAASLNVEQWIN